MDNSSDDNNRICHLKPLSSFQKQHDSAAIGVDAVIELGNAFDNVLQLKDVHLKIGSTLPSDDDASDTEYETIEENCGIILDDTVDLPSKCLFKCATFPKTGHLSSTSEDKSSDSQQQENSSFLRSQSMPTPRKLISAMKGSREKEGASPRKLSVSWAPDVYDPPPTSQSHVPKKTTQQQRKNNKKYGKGKQKGKNTRGGGNAPKNKKHHHKTGGKSERCLSTFVDAGHVASNNLKPSSDVLDFGNDLESPDTNCGSSFLRKAPGAMHLAYAEAT